VSTDRLACSLLAVRSWKVFADASSLCRSIQSDSLQGENPQPVCLICWGSHS
jgi:hypothetical protein